MALKGGSIAVASASATVLSGAVAGKIRAKSVTFRNKTGNTGAIGVGDSTVEADGLPSYFLLGAGESLTLTAPAGEFVEVDFTKLYARAAVNGEVLHVFYAD